MNLFSNLLTVENLTDLFILKYGLFVSLLFYIPFVSILLGSLLFSLINFRKGKLLKSDSHLSFAKFIIEIILAKIWIVFLIGIIPVLGVAFTFSQIYKNVNTEDLSFALLIHIAGIILALTYKGSFSIFKSENNEITNGNISAKKKNISWLNLGGWLGFLLLLKSSYIIFSYINFAISKTSAVDSFSILLNNFSIINYFLFLSISFAITAAIIVVKLNHQKVKMSFSEYGKDFSVKSGILFSIIQPLLFVLIIFSISVQAFSFSYFISTILVMSLMLISSVQFYLWYRGNNIKSNKIVLTILFLLVMLIYHGQLNSEKLNQKNDIKSGMLINLFS
ncbi:MAG: hypothetical protein IPH62_14265 [Ignavibacteriae bacterium]|nr:hypothetical protein [Ignavibacteriota bacterium]